MKESNKKRRVTVDRYSNTPPFNMKSEKMAPYIKNPMIDYTQNQGRVSGNQPMRLCDIKRLYAKKDKPNITSRYNMVHPKLYDTKSISKKSLKEITIKSQPAFSRKFRPSSSTYTWRKCGQDDPVKENSVNEDNRRYKINFTSIPKHKLMKKLLKDFTLEPAVVDETSILPNDSDMPQNNYKLQTEVTKNKLNVLNNIKSTQSKRSKSIGAVCNAENLILKTPKTQCTKKSPHSLVKTNFGADECYRSNPTLKYRSILTQPTKYTDVKHSTIDTKSEMLPVTTIKAPKCRERNYETLAIKNDVRKSASHPVSEEVLRQIDNKYSLKFDKQSSCHKFRNVLYIGRDNNTRTKSSKKGLHSQNKKRNCSVNDPESENSSIQTLNICLLDEDLARKTQLKITTENIKPQTMQSRRQLKKVLTRLEDKALTVSRPNPKATDPSKAKQKMSSNFSIESLRSYFEKSNGESATTINHKLKEQNTENYEVVKSTLKNFSFDKHFPQHAFRQEDGDNLKSKSIKSLYRNATSATNTVASSAVSHVFKPSLAEECNSEDVLNMSVSKCCDVDDSKKNNFVKQQVERLNQLMGIKQREKEEDNTKETTRGGSEVFPSKQRSKFHMNHVAADEGCTLVERIKRQVSIYKMANQTEDEEDEWSEGDEYTAHISFPKETRNAVSMLMTKQTNIELQDDHLDPSTCGGAYGQESGSKLEVKWIPCPRNLLCNKGVHQGSCSISRRISWPGIAARVSASTMSANQV